MSDASRSQLIAKNILDQLDELMRLGKLQPSQVAEIRAHVDPVARPAPPPVTARKPPAIPSSTRRKRCKAMWSYAGAESDELTFVEGDCIEIIEEVDPAWWRGTVVQQDGGRPSPSGLFPSNYVEEMHSESPAGGAAAAAVAVLSPPLPARNIPPLYSPVPSITEQQTPTSTYQHDEKQMQGYHGQSMAMPSPYSGQQPSPWQQPSSPWSSGGAPPPPPPAHPSLHPTPSNQSYYQQEPQAAAQGPSNPALYGTQQPVATTEEEKQKRDKLKKFGGRMGQTMANSFVGGVGFGVGSGLFH